MTDLSYRPRLDDLRPITSASEGLLAPDATAVRTSPASSFMERQGYRADHLGDFVVPLPDPSAIAADVLPVPGSSNARLDYEHFSVVMSRSRRLALFTGVNIDGSASVSVSRGGDPWAFDGRIPEAAQAGDELYANNDFDRGHLVRREDPNWGPTAGVANRDTFHFTNCAPQLSAFNQRTWLSLEDYNLSNARPCSPARSFARTTRSTAASRSRSPIGRSSRSFMTTGGPPRPRTSSITTST